MSYCNLMAVMMPRETWTDGRLDEFEKRMDERFDRVDERFDRVDERFEWVDKRFDAVDKRFDSIEADIREIRYGLIVLAGIMITGFLTLAGLIVF